MTRVSPARAFAEVAAALPLDYREKMVVIGSLAVGYHYFRDTESEVVHTKDLDCVLEPFHAAVGVGQDIARTLLDAGWQRRMFGDHQTPGDAGTPADRLPAIRLYPPGVVPESEGAWFIELLTVPDLVSEEMPGWSRLRLKEGHFGLPSFPYLAVATFGPLKAEELGIRYARPQMMALGNMLEHQIIKPARMRALIGDRAIRRSNKDLGRVLAIVVLADLDDYRPWAADWKVALEFCFPSAWRELAPRAGAGLRALLESPADLEEAHHACINGLLASRPANLDAVRAAGERLIGDAVEKLEELARA